MQTYTGSLMRLGAGTDTPKHSEYSVIQVGKDVIPRVWAPQEVVSFLDLGHEVTLYMRKSYFVHNMILGVKPMGKAGMYVSVFWFLRVLFYRILAYLVCAWILLESIENNLVPTSVVFAFMALCLIEFLSFVYDYTTVRALIRRDRGKILP